MATTHTTTITAVPASQAGALAGHEVRCSCGDVARYSIATMAQEYAAGHVAYMAKKGR